jgi:hypothetical protein
MYSRSTDISVVVRTPQIQTIASGAGRLLTSAYLAGGHLIGRKVNRLAHQLGYGPDASSGRILEHCRSHEGGLSWWATVSDQLQKDCVQLMKYALP